MLLNGEVKWLVAYVLILMAAVITSVIDSWAIWQTILLAVVGIPVVIFGWLWQVGRYG
jgi:hypothetical protein